jgi:trehalose synthase
VPASLTPLVDVPIAALDPARFSGTVSAPLYDDFQHAAEQARKLLAGRVVWNINTTAHGGGVAEMLRSLLGYVRGAGIDARWEVITGDSEFFRVTKRIHNNLHGSAGDGGELDGAERAVYNAVLDTNADALRACVRANDVVIVHDPQTAGLIPAIRDIGARVIWRCHVGTDTPNDLVRRAWAFLLPDVVQADAVIFSHSAFAWKGIDEARIHIVAPSIDAFSPKNYELDADTVQLILGAARIVDGGRQGTPSFVRQDGSAARIDSRARIIDDVPIPSGVPVVTQVSRWDRLKDPVGVLQGFVDHVAPRHPNSHLALAGPDVAAVSDDPEGAEVLAEVAEWRGGLAEAMRDRVHLLCLPMHDDEVNAVMVNALQRHATVAVQKSLAEGFGLTVAEAMWKGRPVVASRVGGIQDQIVDGVSGLLLDDPTDLRAFGGAVSELLDDPRRAAAMGDSAREHVRELFLGPRHLIQYVDLLNTLP